MTSASQDNWFHILRNKWETVPGDISQRLSTRDLLSLTNEELLDRWRKMQVADTTGEGFKVRGWFHKLYQDVFRDKRVLEIGQGLGIDALTFAQSTCEYTCADIVESNLEVVARLAGAMSLNVKTHYIDTLDSLKTLGEYDVIYACGSLHNAPFDFMKKEAALLTPHLASGGRWVQLAYPRERWIRENAPPFEKWGQRTDGEGTPYCEWYDLDKLLSLLAPAEFDVIMSFNFHNNDFNWFDLIKR